MAKCTDKNHFRYLNIFVSLHLLLCALMRIRILTLLILVTLAQSWRIGVLGVVYTLQKAAITRAHCVNIAVPQQMCQGKCYFNRTIQMAMPQDNTTPAPSLPHVVDEMAPVWALIEPNWRANTSFRSARKATLFFYTTWAVRAHVEAVFHPPQLV